MKDLSHIRLETKSSHIGPETEIEPDIEQMALTKSTY